MKFLTLILLTGTFFLLPHNSSLAQEQERKWIVKTNPLSFLYGPFTYREGRIDLFATRSLTGEAKISVEVPVSPTITIEGGGSYLYENPLMNWDRHIDRPEIRSMDVKGFGFHVEAKMFPFGFSGKMAAPEGPYVSLLPSFSFSKVYVNTHFKNEHISIEKDFQMEQYRVVLFHAGYQLINERGVSLDLFFQDNLSIPKIIVKPNTSIEYRHMVGGNTVTESYELFRQSTLPDLGPFLGFELGIAID